MNQNKGTYIKLYRKVINDDWFSKRPFDDFRAFIYILVKARVTPTDVLLDDGTIVHLERGQHFESRSSLAEKFGWTIKKVRAWEGRMVRDKKGHAEGHAKGIVYTIENYSKYQGEGHAEGHAKGQTEGHAEGQRKKNDIKNEYKECEREGARARARMREGTIPRGKLGNVFMTDDEYQDLKLRFENTDRRISEIGYYLANASREYNNHYALILKIASEDHWPRARRAEPEKEPEKILTPEEEAEREAAKEETMEKIRKLHGKGAD